MRFKCRECGNQLETQWNEHRNLTGRRHDTEDPLPCDNPECRRFGKRLLTGQAVPTPEG